MLYIIGRADGVGPVKVGLSRAPRRRLASFQRGCPELLEIVDTAPGHYEQETLLHNALDEHRIHGEWFERGPAVATFARYKRDTEAQSAPPQIHKRRAEQLPLGGLATPASRRARQRAEAERFAVKVNDAA